MRQQQAEGGREAGAGSTAVPVFHSALLAALERGHGAPRAASAEQWRGWLDGAQRRGEFRQAERDWLGVDDWLDTQNALGGRSALRDLVDDGHMLSPADRRRIAENPGLVAAQVTREQLVAHVREHQVQVTETVLSQDAVERMSDDLSLWLGDNLDSDTLDAGPDFNEVAALLDDAAAEHRGEGDADEAARHEAMAAEARNLASGNEPTPPIFGRYVLPGGEAYRELLLTLPNPSRVELGKDHRGRPTWVAKTERDNFTTSHWAQANVLAHVRFNERRSSNGDRVLFVEEIQSDWHQAGRKRGYKREGQDITDAEFAEFQRLGRLTETTPEQDARYDELRALNENGPSNAVPDAPFKATDEWAMLAFKRIVRYAADHGFDSIGWTTGEQQADRYDISKQVHSIAYARLPTGNYDIRARTLEGNRRAGEDFWVNCDASLPEIERHLGKELAEKISAGTGFTHGGRTYLEGLDLKVGGEGMAGFYDRILPAAVNRWAKKLGGGVGQLQVDVSEKDADRFEVVLANGKVVQATQSRRHADATAAAFAGAQVREIDHTVCVHGLAVTDAMREMVLAGLPLFKREVVIDAEDVEEDDDRPSFRF